VTENWSQESYITAYRFAAEAHNGQLVPGTELPYIMHLSFVSMEIIAALAIELFQFPDLAVQCALLHDVIEDTKITYEKVKSEFRKAVADGVLALTKDENIGSNIENKWERKREILKDSLERIKRQPKEIWMVKLADRITNLQPPPHYWSSEKIDKYKSEAIMIYDYLSPASQYLGNRLKSKIENYPGDWSSTQDTCFRK